LNDGQGSRILLPSSNNSFELFATMSSTDPNVSPVISDDGLSLYNINYFINNMGIDSSVISITNAGLGYTNLTSANISISAPDVGSNTPVFSISANANGAITSVYTTYPGSGYLKSPTITISGSNTSQAIITVQGETSATGGNAYAKYFTKKVVLAPGQNAGDLRVYYTAYKPAGTAIYIYYRILSPEDTSIFENQGWQLMTQITELNTFSTSRTNLIEYEVAPGILNMANNNISYVSTNGQTYTNFNQFAIKVVMATSDNTNVPFLSNIRALALPSGTGD
jgi:hypothetical protein